MSQPKWVDWIPHWKILLPDDVPMIQGRYTERVFNYEDHMHEEQQVEAKCNHCGAEYKRPCSSGHVKEHIARFAAVHAHLHGDVMAAPKIVRPGSLRNKPLDEGEE